MKPIGIVLLVIAIILVAAMIVLYFLGKKAQKKKEEQDEQMKAAAQTVTMLIIDKKRMKMKDAGLPSQVMEQSVVFISQAYADSVDRWKNRSKRKKDSVQSFRKSTMKPMPS